MIEQGTDNRNLANICGGIAFKLSEERQMSDRLVAALTKVVAISDRKHDAWDEARAAIAEVAAMRAKQ